MEFFGNGKKAPPKGKNTGLFIDPDENKHQGAPQARTPGYSNKQPADVEDVPVKPTRRKEQASTLDLGDILGGESPKHEEAAPAQRPAGEQRKKAPKQPKANVLDLLADEPPASGPEVPTRAPVESAMHADSAEDAAIQGEQPLADITAQEQHPSRVEGEEPNEQPHAVEKLVAEEVEEAQPLTRAVPEWNETPSAGQASATQTGDAPEETTIRMHFKPSAGETADASDNSGNATSKKSSFFDKAKAGNPFQGFKKRESAEGQQDRPAAALKQKQKGLEGLFKKKPKKDAAAEARSEQQESGGSASPKAAKHSIDELKKKFFSGLGKKSQKVEGAEKVKPSLKAKPKDVKRAGAKRVNEQYIAVSLTAGNEMFWKVTETGLEQVDELQGRNAGPIASFTKEDVRIYVDAAQTNRQAAELALQAIEEKPRLINLSKSSNAIFTTPAQRIAGYKVKVGPGLPLLQTLLKPHFEQNKEVLKEVISGFLLLNAETRELLVVLYHFDVNGNISPPEVTANPTDVHMTLRQFANSRKVDPAAADILLFRNEELLSVGVPKHLYPSDADFLGIPVSTALTVASLVTTAAALGCGGWAAQEYLQGVQLSAQAKRVKQQTESDSRKVHELLSTSVASFAKHQTLDVDYLVKQAQGFWIPRSKVSMAAELGSQTYVVSLPLGQMTSAGGEPSSLLDAVNTDQVMALTNMKVPEHCTKQSPSVSGTLDVIQLTINCETAPGPFNRYRAD